MKNAVRTGVFGLISVCFVACIKISPEPETSTPLSSVSSRHALHTEDITVRAALVSYPALKEFDGAKCTFTRGRQKLEFTAPQKISIEILPGKQPDILLECQQLIGARVRTSSDTFEPEIKTVTKDHSSETRVYQKNIGALFLQK